MSHNTDRIHVAINRVGQPAMGRRRHRLGALTAVQVVMNAMTRDRATKQAITDASDLNVLHSIAVAHLDLEDNEFVYLVLHATIGELTPADTDFLV
jgi:hypothetical protein